MRSYGLSWSLSAKSIPARYEFGEAAVSVCHIFPGDRKASLIEHLAVTGIQGIRGQRRQQIGPQGRGAAQRLVTPPPRDGGVVPGQQDGRHFAPAPYPWPGEYRSLQQAGHRPVAAAERIIGRGLGVAEGPRQQPGVLGNAQSAPDDSFGGGDGPMAGLLEGPVFTRPRVWRGREVPAVLLSGDHAAIARWRRDEALRRTAALRPDLLAALPADTLDSRDRQVLGEAGFPVSGKDMAH